MKGENRRILIATTLVNCILCCKKLSIIKLLYSKNDSVIIIEFVRISLVRLVMENHENKK